MKRREFIGSIVGASLAAHLGRGTLGQGASETRRSPGPLVRPGFSLDHHSVRFFNPAIRERFKVMVIADTHLFTDDERGEPYREYSERMARAYNRTSHFQTGEPTNPEESFERSLAIARESEADLVALLGDIFSFPSEAAVEWARRRLEEAGLPYIYVAGNHDWHYEGMPGTLEELRATWIEKRLLPLYRGDNPLMAVREVKGVRFVAIDDSYYEILPEQLEFFRRQVATGEPLILLMHIPLYAPGRSVGYGCGHPDWRAETDRNWQLERRPRWPEEGHTETTMAFHREVFTAPNLLGVLAGHIHRQSLDVMNGVPQFVADANATGAYLSVEFAPHEG
jgi:3',5'-cyclic AMP phosphodiesterase CpdA